METDQTALSAKAQRRWPLFVVGVLLFVLGPALNFGQMMLGYLWTAWYVPVLATLGVVLMFVSIRQRRGVWRSVGLVLFALMCGGEWYLMLVAAKSPEYTGPARPGSKLPEFAAVLADGAPFTNKDVENELRSVLVFNRGRW